VPIITGVAGTGAIGTVIIETDDSVIVTGVAGAGSVGAVFISGWTTINDAQVPNWEEIDVAA
jgi:deoxycytidylate deaminase